MNTSLKIKNLILPFAVAITLSACDNDDDNTQPSGPSEVSTPATYSFERNGMSSVSYSGQTDRLNQLDEMKAKLLIADGGSQVQAADLLAMYNNNGGNGGGNFSFSSSKQLADKTFAPDVPYFETYINQTATASIDGANNVTATKGTAGLLTRSNNKTILVDENGMEFTQAIEKGLMGATFFYQIANVYTTADKIGAQVDNTSIVDGKNYTTLEHHFDEAFGYFGAPTDYKANYSGNEPVRFWAKYANSLEANAQLSDPIMNAFKKGRQAIVENRRDVLNEQVKIINEQVERLIAACSIHYVNKSLSTNNTGDQLHYLSELYAFTRALRFSNPTYRKYSITEVDALISNYIGTNLWDVTPTGLNTLKNELSATYGFDAVKDAL
jgi:hypothetical protein